MATFLHGSIVYGPVMSRRLGVSLGLNLSPTDGKVCTFDCLYCECGLNEERRPRSASPTADEVAEELRDVLERLGLEGPAPDAITMAGNGEPTANPQFADIVKKVVALRDELAPQARISVLTNATLLDRPAVREAMAQVDDCIAKLDTVDPAYIALLDRPRPGYDVGRVVDSLCTLCKTAHVSIQTMFLAGTWEGRDVCSTGDRYVEPWLEALERIRPERVMIYTIARDTSVPTLEKVSPAMLDDICSRVHALGVPCTASY